MLRTDSLYLQDLSQFIQTSVKVITELHEVLDVIDCGEVDLQSNAANYHCHLHVFAFS